VAVSVKVLQSGGNIKKALVVDCDLHQGNGTAYAFRDDPSVFTFSIHQENNYPFHKPKSDMDIGLPDYTGDKRYLEHLYDKIPKIISTFKPDFILYVAGADPYKEDQLGRLALSKKGLRERDNFIYTQARNFGVPIAVTLAGGYAVNREDTVDIHFATIEESIKVFTV
jgi:acetoin utilization deacetylase AcuC-like enzyme